MAERPGRRLVVGGGGRGHTEQVEWVARSSNTWCSGQAATEESIGMQPRPGAGRQTITFGLCQVILTHGQRLLSKGLGLKAGQHKWGQEQRIMSTAKI